MTIVRQHNDNQPVHLPSRKLGKMNASVVQPSIQIHNHIPGSGPQTAGRFSATNQLRGDTPNTIPTKSAAARQPSDAPVTPAARKATLDFPRARYPRLGTFLLQLEADDVDWDYQCYHLLSIALAHLQSVIYSEQFANLHWRLEMVRR
jgi:hypothetical protein